MYKGPMDKAKGEYDQGWEVGVGGVGESGWRKMEEYILKQQFLKKDGKKNGEKRENYFPLGMNCFWLFKKETQSILKPRKDVINSIEFLTDVTVSVFKGHYWYDLSTLQLTVN